jgi:Na+-driven multidrug efflux pump
METEKDKAIIMEQTEANREKEQLFILNGGLWRVMVQQSWPAVAALVLYGLNTLLDAVFVGRFVSETAFAGISLVYPLAQITTALGSMIGVGAGSILSIAIGSLDEKTQSKVMGGVNFLTIVFTVVFMSLGLLFSTRLIGIMGGTGEALMLGDNYFRITIFGSLLWIYSLAGNMIIRAEGKMKTAALIMGIGLAVNVVFNTIFIIGLGMGVEGAAWGTNIGMFVYCIMNWLHFGRNHTSFKTKIFSIAVDKEIIPSILELGTPSFITSIMVLIQSVIVLGALSKYGTIADIAFYGAVFRIFTFLSTPLLGMKRALQPVLGINYGAKQYDRTLRFFKVFVFGTSILMLPFWLVSMIAPGSVLGLVLTEQAFTGTQFFYFRIYMALLPALSIFFMATTFFPAIGKAKPTIIIGFIRQFILCVPVMLILPKLIGVSGIYYGSFLIDAVVMVITIVVIVKEFKAVKARESETVGA